jgi:hypothetical protein
VRRIGVELRNDGILLLPKNMREPMPEISKVFLCPNYSFQRGIERILGHDIHPGMNDEPDEQYTPEETARRRDCYAFQRRSPVTTISVSWLPQREQTSRLRQSGTVVSGPYRRAISAESALVPPSAARSDAVAGST